MSHLSVDMLFFQNLARHEPYDLGLPPIIVDLSVTGKQWYGLSEMASAVFYQSGAEDLQRLQVDGGSHITLVGGQFRPTVNNSASTLAFFGQSKSVSVIGALVDNGSIGERDGIVVGSKTTRPDVTIENTAVLNISGSYAGVHGDIFQSYAQVGDVTIRNLVGISNYQGIFLGGGPDMQPSSLTLDGVHLDYTSGSNKYPVLLWLGDEAGATFSTTMTNVTFGSQAASRGTDFATVIKDDQGTARGSLQDGFASFPTNTVTGTISFEDKPAIALPYGGAVGAEFDWLPELLEAAGVDTLISGTSSNDVLKGTALSDYFSGGYGADTMVGGLGDDVFIVDNKYDRVMEDVSGGIDTVMTASTYALASNVENLVLTGSGPVDGTGNALGNLILGGLGANVLDGREGHDQLYGAEGQDTLYGGSGDDILDGGRGVDIMFGQAGDDVYYVDNAGDIVTEQSDDGVDTVVSGVDYVLGLNVERLVLSGDASVAVGNAYDNVLIGTDAGCQLDGLAGDDLLVGGAGADKLNGGWGDDVLVGGTGADIMDGHDGDDTYILGSGPIKSLALAMTN